MVPVSLKLESRLCEEYYYLIYHIILVQKMTEIG